MRRTLLLLLALATVVCTHAQRRSRSRIQEEGPRDLIVTISDTSGNPLSDLPVSAIIRRSGEMVTARTDRHDNRHFTVMDSDTLDLFVRNHIFLVPVAGLDSLAITIRPPKDSITRLDPVTVSAQRSRVIDTPFGRISPENYAGSGTFVDMEWAPFAINLEQYLSGRVAGLSIDSDGNPRIRNAFSLNNSAVPIIFVDGVEAQGFSFREISDMIPIDSIESILVSKDGEGLGMRGAGGAIYITTKWKAGTN